MRYDVRNQQATAGQTSVLGERVVLVGTAWSTLARPHIVTSSIVVNNATRTQVFVAGTDYAVSVVGQDTRIQPQQRIEAARDRNRTYVAAYTPATRKWARLTNDSITSATVADNGKVALGISTIEYAIESTWGEGANDVYLLDPQTGNRTTVAKKLKVDWWAAFQQFAKIGRAHV